jgi:hypothetical protein
LCRSWWGLWWKLVFSQFNILAMSRTFMLQDSFQLNFNENVNSLNPLNSTCEAFRWKLLRLPEGLCTHNPNYQSVILITSRNRKRKGDTGMSSNGMIDGLFWSKLMERARLSSIQSKKFTVRNLRLPIPKCQWRSEWQNFSSWVWWGYDKWRHWVWNCKSPASVAYLISMQKWWWIRAWNSQLSILRFSTDCSLSKDCNTRSQQLMLIYNSL